jgi:hypothetical protein
MHDTTTRMGLTAGLILFSLVQATARTPRPQAMQADSIVLVRGRCYGTCPAYRLRLSASGDVEFHSRNPGDEGLVHSDTLSDDGFAHLVAMAERIGFFDLPDAIDEGDPVWCAEYATDHPTYVGSIDGAAGRKVVAYYTGCFGGDDDPGVRAALGRLKDFFAAIDSVAGSSRWVRPAPYP